ncbi:hypothetical protein HQ393_14470 [Chitinibacter bivalviorum]|uniref:PH domain-containing protein n=1 Tax=Chitinibacter bivalviorum TaxID=2739434 RepID=A0A7H9BMN7_9NEIS|nr:hypothetical protein [Chitinibacter bivalviorum]QLG89351.1 hypothetical protein HQ393_14470 [Chitinibacter bivalviorum]
MNQTSPLRLETKPSVSFFLMAISLTMWLLLYKIHQDGGFQHATSPQWLVVFFEVFAFLFFPVLLVFASRKIEITENQIVVTQYFGLLRRNYNGGGISFGKFIPSTGNHGKRVKIQFEDGRSFSVWQRDTTNWDCLLQYLEAKNLLLL